MSEHEKPRNAPNAASLALVSLRTLLGKTQAQFAVTEVNTAVSTVARWEGPLPPRGDALIQLARIADREENSEANDDKRRAEFKRLADRFRTQHVLDAIEDLDRAAMLPGGKNWAMQLVSEKGAFFCLKFDDPEDYEAVHNLLTVISSLRQQGTSKAKKAAAAAALKALAEAAR